MVRVHNNIRVIVSSKLIMGIKKTRANVFSFSDDDKPLTRK